MAPLPPLRSISLTRPIQPPRKIIKDDADVEAWKHTTGYKDFSLFISRLNSAVIERDIPSVDQEERSIVSVI
jgi:serine/threonine-protein phosphatase 2A activator